MQVTEFQRRLSIGALGDYFEGSNQISIDGKTIEAAAGIDFDLSTWDIKNEIRDLQPGPDVILSEGAMNVLQQAVQFQVNICSSPGPRPFHGIGARYSLNDWIELGKAWGLRLSGTCPQ